MVMEVTPVHARPIHAVHAMLLAFPFPFFLAALISDIAYWNTFQIQWSNFSSWLIIGGLIGGGFSMLWALVDLIRFRRSRSRRPLFYFLALLAMFVVGFVNELVHAKDAWAIMPEGLYLSIVTVVLTVIASWIGFSGYRSREYA